MGALLHPTDADFDAFQAAYKEWSEANDNLTWRILALQSAGEDPTVAIETLSRELDEKHARFMKSSEPFIALR